MNKLAMRRPNVALDRSRMGQRRLCWFIVDGWISWDRQGWEFIFCNPVCGITLTYHFSTPWMFDIRCNHIGLYLFAKWPTFPGEYMYRFNWEKKWAIKELVEREVAHGNDPK
jgi:hypothetical protein